jgi:hypothetical protein
LASRFGCGLALAADCAPASDAPIENWKSVRHAIPARSHRRAIAAVRFNDICDPPAEDPPRVRTRRHSPRPVASRCARCERKINSEISGVISRDRIIPVPGERLMYHIHRTRPLPLERALDLCGRSFSVISAPFALAALIAGGLRGNHVAPLGLKCSVLCSRFSP